MAITPNDVTDAPKRFGSIALGRYHRSVHARPRGRTIGEMQYEDTYRLAYIRGPEGIIIGLAEQLS